VATIAEGKETMPTYGRYTIYLAERKLIPDRKQGVNPATSVVPDLVRYTFTCS